MVSTFQRMLTAFCLTAALAAPAAAQGVPAGSVSFRNDLTMPIIVQGVSRVGPMVKRGAPMVIAPGKSVTEFNVPAGMRVYQIYDGNQPQRKLAQDVQVGVFPGRPMALVVKQLANMQIVVAP
jgi:hypothetical protein